jgi:putative ABC transport system permease protein
MSSLLRNLLGGLRGLFRKERVERELDEELRAYLGAAVIEKMRRGMSREEAQRTARIEMGGTEKVKEQVRAVSWESMVETLWQDLKFGLRLLRFNPAFAAAAILSLALGIGANTAIFQLLDAVRLRTLPVKNPEQMVKINIDHRNGASGSFSSRYPDLTYGQWEHIRAQQQAFSSVFAWGPTLFNISPGGEVHYVQGLWVSGEFFQTLGVEPALGRLLTPADDRSNCNSAGVVISSSFWKHEYAGENSVIGRTLAINRHAFEIIGVTPPDFYGVEVGRYFDVAVPLCAESIVNGEDSQLHRPEAWWLSAMGRLKSGWNIERAAAQLRAISPGIFEATVPPAYNTEQAKHYAGYKLGAFPGNSGSSELRNNFENPLWFLLALAGLVLLIASANLANLMLARASAREREMGMRMAVGASRGRLIRQLLAESFLLAGIGAGLGALLAQSLSQILLASLSKKNDPLFMDLGTDWRVLGFTAALAGLTCILFGLAPAWRATSVAPGVVLKESGRGATGGRSRFGLRRILVVSQIALSLMLLVGALLFARSLNNLATLDAGFRQEGILVTDIDFTTLNLSNERRLAFSEELLSRVRAIPGVDSAAIAAIVPLSGNGENHDLYMGTSGSPNGEAPVAAFNRVSPGFFQTLQTPVLAGRDFDEHDLMGSPKVAIVNEEFARKLANGKNPVGMSFRIGRMRTVTSPYEIIGLVKDTKYSELREEVQPIVYTCMTQYDRPDTDAWILIRSNAPLANLLSEVKSTANQAHPDLDITFVPFHKMIQDGLLRDRLMAALSGFFGVLAVVLAAIGLYGVISYMVERRRKEIGIRMVLGAEQNKIIRLVLRETGVLLLIGLVAGIALALATARTAASMLFGLKPTDSVTYILAVVCLSGVAALSSFLPARRAARLDPMEALRNE